MKQKDPALTQKNHKELLATLPWLGIDVVTANNLIGYGLHLVIIQGFSHKSTTAHRVIWLMCVDIAARGELYKEILRLVNTPNEVEWLGTVSGGHSEQLELVDTYSEVVAEIEALGERYFLQTDLTAVYKEPEPEMPFINSAMVS